MNYFEFALEECGNARFLDIFLWLVRKLSGDLQLHFVFSAFELLLDLVEAVCTREKNVINRVSDAELRILRILADDEDERHQQLSGILSDYRYQNPFEGIDEAVRALD